MTGRALPGGCALAFAAALLAITPAGSARAQANQQTVTNENQQGRQQGSQAQGGSASDYVAQVGAGTTNGSTTGYSGKKDQSAKSPEPKLPDLPSAKLCDDWKGSQAYESCMKKVAQP